MANLSWQFYKGYYEGFPPNDWGKLKSDKPEDKKRIEQFFIRKNDVFLQSNILPVPKVPATQQPVALYTTYPGLLIGSGYAHGAGAIGEFKIGFHLDHTTGMPVIPGSSVKGALRAVFPQFTVPKGQKIWTLTDFSDETHDETAIARADYIASHLPFTEKDPQKRRRLVHHLELSIFEGLNVTKCTDKPVYYSIYQRDIFHDAYPMEENNRGELFGTDSITPHARPGVPYVEAMLKNPTPLLFLKVLPNVQYHFCFDLKITDTIPGIGATEKRELFETLLCTFGIGAKTNVGYGQFSKARIKSVYTDNAPVRRVARPPANGPNSNGGDFPQGNIATPVSQPGNAPVHTTTQKPMQPAAGDRPWLLTYSGGNYVTATVHKIENGMTVLKLDIPGYTQEKYIKGEATVGSIVKIHIKKVKEPKGEGGKLDFDFGNLIKD